MRNFIYSLIENLQAGVLDIVAVSVCSGLALVALAVFAAAGIMRSPSCGLLARGRKFTKKYGRVTAANACLFGKKVIKPCGRQAYNAYVCNLRFAGVQAAGRAAVPFVTAKSGAPGGFLALGTACTLLSCAALALCGYSLAALAAAALAVAAVWIVCAVIYAIICAVIGAAENKRAEKAVNMIVGATSPAPVDVNRAIAENPAFVAKSDLDKFFEQMDALLNAGVSKQVAAAVLGGIDGMLNSNMYCGAERLRLASLKERVKKICA